MKNITDAHLIQKSLGGDRSAFSRLIERHRHRVAQIAYQALGNADDAQDVAQEAFVYAFQRLSELRDTARFSGWLRALTLSLCTDYRRRRGTRRLGEPLTMLNEIAEEVNLIQRLAVREAVAHLPEAQQTTFLLRYLGGWSEAEVATLLHLSINTVRSRLMSAKRRLRTDLSLYAPLLANEGTQGNQMPVLTNTLSETHTNLLYAAFPDARLLSLQQDPESWMPFAFRVRLALSDGTETSVDFRHDLTPERVALLTILSQQGIPTPHLLSAPEPLPEGGYVTLARTPEGENLGDWALGGTPHRIRVATERAFEAIERLRGATEALRESPVGATLENRTLAVELAEIRAKAGDHLTDPWFSRALEQVAAAVADRNDPLVFTYYLHYFPNFVRVQVSDDPMNTPLGWPGDRRLEANPITELVAPYGHFGDPLLDVAMVWIYDCYPFVHTGFVEQYLWRRGVSRREFAPRLALQALKIIQRELPVQRPAEEEAAYYDALHGYVTQALGWM
jgi:RNA polymerase sigma-70 factor (ECF subfamily)